MPRFSNETQRSIAPGAADWPQPNKHDEPRFGTNGAPRGRNQPSGTSRRWQASKQVFQHGGAGRTHGGHGEGQYGASRGVRSGLARSARILLLRVLARPPCSSVLKDLLPHFGPAARTQHRWVSAGQREDGCISRADARRAVLAEAPANQCVIGVFAENPRSPRGFLRLVVQTPTLQRGPPGARTLGASPRARHERFSQPVATPRADTASPSSSRPDTSPSPPRRTPPAE